ncbi:MAG: DNA photolyase [Spirochaetes bacterium]|nr:DNA photolyase [Spirochaetota bacterium]MBN2770508.1 DNA photolyase [Spirochaetota bacterium]
MIKSDSIKAVIYNNSEVNEYVDRFLNLQNVDYYCYDSDDELNRIIANVSKKNESKEVIIFKKFLGRIFQMCPGTPEMICCNYRLVNTGFNCLYNCAYCYLQIYLNSFGIQLFSNMDQLYSHIDPFFDQIKSDYIYRIGTGEFTDSLMFDDLTGIGKKLIEIFASYPSIMLELKTKSSNIDHLLDIEKKGNSVIGFSINTDTNSKLYEEGAATVKERLIAAGKAAKAGYYTAFHFDPVIIYDNWQEEYLAVVDMLFDYLPVTSIAWISMGGFRYQGSFIKTVRNNFPGERMSTGEFFPCKDMKYRYQWHLRSKIYRTLNDAIRLKTDHPYVYMCMESSEMWQEVFGKNFETSEHLEKDFSDHLRNMLVMDKRLSIDN